MGDPEFKERYARACDVRADAIFEEMLSIADDGRNDWMENISKEGEIVGYRENGEALRRSALRIEARKWLLGKMKPKVYGDKIQTEVSGPDGGAVQVVSRIERVIVRVGDNGAGSSDTNG